MLDQVRFGSRRDTRRRWPGWALAGLAAAVIATLVVIHQGHHHPPRRPGVLAPVREVGHRLLGVTAGWQLATYGPDGLVRIQPAAGRVTRTAVPPLASTGPAYFLAGPSQAIIRPLDFVPGYLIPYGRRARPLTGLLASGGLVVPGPRPGQAWIQPGYQARSLSLAWLDGRSAGHSLRLPRGIWVPTPDGQGYPLMNDTAKIRITPSVYDLRPGGLHRVPGYVVAVGPHRWLMASCTRKRCTAVTVDPTSGARRVLPGLVPYAELGQPGVISPDGTTAAVFGVDGTQVTLHLISLVTGAQEQLAVPLGNASASGQTLAWSPDSRWLFVVAAHGRLVAVRASTGLAQGLGVTLPPVSQIAIQA
ncbi:MAG: hypothetical protein ACRDRJ_54410 [Streptosporangiaceae bacterium]